jgi:SAM-dependent methyltransferase
MKAHFDAAAVRSYYDRQTAGFVALGQGGCEGAIHRAVWGPGVQTRAEAFHFVDDRLVAQIDGLAAADARPVSALHVVDLGCGVGGSLTYVATRRPVQATGVTLSPVQARLASARVDALGLHERVRIVEGDYTSLPAGVGPADVAFAIESFVHGPDPAAFFAEAARLLRPGGRLLICDDMRGTTDPDAARALDRFRRGWHINALVTRSELQALATEAGFAHDHTIDLTPWLEIDRPRDRLIAAFVALVGWLPLHRTRIAHVTGGAALRQCLRRGWVAYELACFRRPDGNEAARTRRAFGGRGETEQHEAEQNNG